MEALEGFARAATLDPAWAEPRQREQQLIDFLERLTGLLENKVFTGVRLILLSYLCFCPSRRISFPLAGLILLPSSSFVPTPPLLLVGKGERQEAAKHAGKPAYLPAGPMRRRALPRPLWSESGTGAAASKCFATWCQLWHCCVGKGALQLDYRGKGALVSIRSSLGP